MEKLDIYHRKALRKVLHMDTTYVDRRNTNQEIYRRANEAIQNEALESFDTNNQNKKLKIRKVEKLSDIYIRRKHAYFAIIATAPTDSPAYQVTFERHTNKPHEHLPRRQGTRKEHWASQCLIEIWNKWISGEGSDDEFDETNDQHRQKAYQCIEELIIKNRETQIRVGPHSSEEQNLYTTALEEMYDNMDEYDQ